MKIIKDKKSSNNYRDIIFKANHYIRNMFENVVTFINVDLILPWSYSEDMAHSFSVPTFRGDNSTLQVDCNVFGEKSAKNTKDICLHSWCLKSPLSSEMI